MFVDDLKTTRKYNVAQICKVLKVSQDAWYRWHTGYKYPSGAVNRLAQIIMFVDIKDVIVEMFNDIIMEGEKVSVKLTTWRKFLKLSQEEAAALFGVTKITFYRWEATKCRMNATCLRLWWCLTWLHKKGHMDEFLRYIQYHKAA